MADRRINQFAFPTSNQNVQRDDIVAIERGGYTYKAKINGGLLLPVTSSADNGKVLKVVNGVLQLATPTAGGGWALRATQTITTAPSVAGAGYSQAIADFSLSAYTDTMVTLSRTDGESYSFRIPALTGVVYYDALWRVWFSDNSTLNYIRAGAADVADTIHIYGRVG